MPTKSAYTGVKRVIRYLKDQPDFDIMYRRRTDPQQKQMPFHVHVDAAEAFSWR